jgi:hypothetical protein
MAWCAGRLSNRIRAARFHLPMAVRVTPLKAGFKLPLHVTSQSTWSLP